MMQLESIQTTLLEKGWTYDDVPTYIIIFNIRLPDDVQTTRQLQNKWHTVLNTEQYLPSMWTEKMYEHNIIVRLKWFMQI